MTTNEPRGSAIPTALPGHGSLRQRINHLSQNDGPITESTNLESFVETEIPTRSRLDTSYGNIKRFWSKHVSFYFTDDEGVLSDHLANERTYHNWLALSNALAWMGIVILQMSKIHQAVRPDHYNLFRYKACICQGLAILILLIGTYRFFYEQSAINGTGTRAKQWTLTATGVAILLLCLSFFVLLIIANTDIVNR